MIQILNRRATLVVSAVLFLVCSVVITFAYQQNIPGISYTHFIFPWGFETAQVQAVFSQWGSAGRAGFLAWVWLDYIYPVTYAFFLASLMAVLLRDHWHQFSKYFLAFGICLPFCALFFDYVENCYQIVMVQRLAEVPVWFFWILIVVMYLKWLCLTLSLIFIVYIKGVLSQ